MKNLYNYFLITIFSFFITIRSIDSKLNKDVDLNSLTNYIYDNIFIKSENNYLNKEEIENKLNIYINEFKESLICNFSQTLESEYNDFIKKNSNLSLEKKIIAIKKHFFINKENLENQIFQFQLAQYYEISCKINLILTNKNINTFCEKYHEIRIFLILALCNLYRKNITNEENEKIIIKNIFFMLSKLIITEEIINKLNTLIVKFINNKNP